LTRAPISSVLGARTKMETRQSLRQRVANLASSEEGNFDASPYWREVLPSTWEGPYPRHWCGAFTLWALRVALGCTWQWEVGKGYLYRLKTTLDPDIGDICYKDRPYQHHAILTAIGANADGKPYVISQDGNSGSSPGVVEEHWRARGQWTAFYSIEPLIAAAIAKEQPT
jgi:hypothetical protein